MNNEKGKIIEENIESYLTGNETAIVSLIREVDSSQYLCI
jgi:hypothetical protein